jgi:hypothetical protein
MKPQIRPYVVEVKQRRGRPKRNRSIWGDLDLSAIAADGLNEAAAAEPKNFQLIDSDATANKAEDGNQQAEHLMADPQETESTQTLTAEPAKGDAVEAKAKAPRTRKTAKAQPKRSVAKGVAKAAMSEPASVSAAKGSRKTYSASERAQKLGQIRKSIGRGESVKSATRQAGISEQTYYQWKKAASAAPESGELKDLLTLEEENARLKKMLAEQLRKENAELKKKLGMS